MGKIIIIINYMKKLKRYILEVLDEIHLYTDKIEAMIKGIILGVSWLGGIVTIKDTADTRALSSAYMIFALSILMEFGLRIKGKKHWLSRVIYVIYLGAMISILLIAIMCLTGTTFRTDHYKIMFELSKWIMIFIGLDIIIVWIGPDVEHKSIWKNKKNDAVSKRLTVESDEVKLFNEKLFNGYLGNIDKGDNDE